MSAKEQTQEKELQERWKEAIASLQGSHLRKQGNPLYVLPWYMVIGESGSGKTTSIGSAKLSTFSDVNRVSGISGTRNCDWWFFEQAILLDTAGRYAMPVDQGKDKEEWQQFLNLLVKYRKKEPIHGLIVTVAADKMLESTPETMAADGKSIRRRIDELMRVLGAKFPVYVLVTKCDLVQGMTQFCERLPEGGLNQPMGYVNQDLSADVGTFLDRAMNTLSERLRNLRLILLHSGGSGGTEPGLLLFPEEFGNLRRGLEPFMKAAFLANPYQETPILRGLFFSSGRQEGSPYSHFLNSLGLVGERDVLPGTNRGLFLHDFYSKVLPRDKGLFAPTKRALEWQTLTRNLGLTTWVILGIVVCGLMSYSFVKNLRTVREASNEFAKAPALQRELLADMIVMDRFGQSILKVEKSNQGWWTPRFGLTESIRVEEGLKAKYCKQFREGFLTAFDRKLAGEMSSVSASTPDDAAAQYVDHLVRRINLLKARLGGQGLETISKLPQPAYLAFLAAGGQDVGPDIRKKFGSLYFYYLAWRTDTSDINQEVGILQGWLRHVLASRGTNFQWLVVWAEKQSGSPPVSLKEFWGGSQPVSGERPISPAFTKKGKEQVDSFVGEIESAVADPVAMASQKAALGKWYPQACLSAWGQFAAGFQRGVDTLKGQKEWQGVAARAATDQGPHMAFVARLASELEFLGEEENLPAWFQQAYQYQSIRSQAQAAGVAAKATESGKKLLARIERTFGKGTEGSSAALAAQKTYQEYIGLADGRRPGERLAGAGVPARGADVRGRPVRREIPLLRRPGGGGTPQGRRGREPSRGRHRVEADHRSVRFPLDVRSQRGRLPDAGDVGADGPGRIPGGDGAPGLAAPARAGGPGLEIRQGTRRAVPDAHVEGVRGEGRPRGEDPVRPRFLQFPLEGRVGGGRLRGGGREIRTVRSLHQGASDGREPGGARQAARNAPRAAVRGRSPDARQPELPGDEGVQLVARFVHRRGTADQRGEPGIEENVSGGPGVPGVPPGFPRRPAHVPDGAVPGGEGRAGADGDQVHPGELPVQRGERRWSEPRRPPREPPREASPRAGLRSAAFMSCNT